MIIYHADDYGISINASKEILALVQQGKLSGISVIPNMSCFADCIDLLLPVMKEHPALTVRRTLLCGSFANSASC